MAYEIYKKILNKEKYFMTWNDSENYKQLTKELKETIYQRYLIKCKVFQRDNFTCQNGNCLRCHNKQYHEELTAHHIKAKRNKGKDTERNQVTLCGSIHKSYERAKIELKFPNAENLPPHIRGHTFKLNKPKNINWKKVKDDMKKLRKNLKQHCGIKLTWKQIAILMKFLYMEFEED